ncbi:MAG TPA: DNA topoisomerase subunit B [Acidimicrobiia bacterium]|nr:DNA topoisomerase subunit B [Acidimicrobiia bacterium]
MAAQRRAAATSEYGAAQITVLEGLDPVRRRPGMYIGSTGAQGLHHLVWEVVDNAVDEAMGGFATRVDVTLLADGGCRVTDDGRGIPVDPHPQYKGKSAAEVVMTTLHAGGKFGDGGYKVSGGLHGVGVSVVNALSARLVLEVDRDGNTYRQVYAPEKTGRKVLPGVPQGKLRAVAKSKRGHTGTTITFWPDPDVFEEIEFRAATIMERLQVMAYLHAGLAIGFHDERKGHEHEETFHSEAGIVDFVSHLNASKEPLIKDIGSFSASEPDGDVDVAWQWNTGYHEGLFTFANGISTTEGGMHAEGFKRALTNAINRYAKDRGLLKAKDTALQGDDVREGLTAIVSVRLQEPQFEGQTKTKLGNTEIRSLVERLTNERFGRWLEEHPNPAKAIVGKAMSAARARGAAKQARELTRRKSALEGVGMPDKLADCSSRAVDDTELFIVEGNSAGGSARDARSPKTQAILPLRGKILNVERASMDKIVANAEIQALVSAIGGGIGHDFDLTKARYGKVVILADADVDGGHIRTLLITFFYRQMTPLVDAGRLYVAQPPLYSVDISSTRQYIADDAARQQVIEANPNRQLVFARFKGLGEMDYPELSETCMDPATRNLVRIDVDEAVICDERLSVLMGDDVELRKQFIQQNAKDVRFLDI